MAISTTFTLKFVGAAVERGLARVQSGFKSLGGVAMKVGKSLLSPFAALTALLGTGALVGGLMSFIKGSSGAASSIEDLTMQFETLTKSASITKSLLDDFREEAAKSPLSIEDYAEAGKLLLNFGTNVKDVMPRLKTLADVSMGNSDRFAGLALAFAQTTAKGRLMGQELNQMTERGFNPLQIISKQTGISMGDLMKRMEDGGISIKAVAAAFTVATSKGGAFYQAIEKGSTTTSGKIAKVADNLTQLKVAFGTGFNDGLKIALDAANTKLPQLMAKFTEFGKLIGKTISEAVNGDLQRLVSIGELIGTAIAGGIKIGIKSAGRKIAQSFWEMLESNNPIRKTEWGSKQGKFSTAISENKTDVRREEIAALVEVLRPMVNLVKNPIPSGYRLAEANEPATMMDGNRVVRILESIDQKLSYQP
jgi:tape measure domain-containing protein